MKYIPNMKTILLVITCLFFFRPLYPQSKQDMPDLSGFGKIWAMEHLPVDYFQQKYQFVPDDQWLERVRLSSLQFATYCSASFISPDGLILTNDHCARGAETEDGENFDSTGFYAATPEEEKKIPGLFVRQLVLIADISAEIDQEAGKYTTDAGRDSVRQEVINRMTEEYASREEWKDLEIEPVTYYSGVKTSLYGYKKYSDIRLVCLPEVVMGFYGGDPDNFAYPRYALDFTIFRAYENDKPVNSADFYFPVNTAGAVEDELVFVTGHPGSTERYRTVAQYEYDRDYRYRILYTYLKNRYDILAAEAKKRNSRHLEDQLFIIANSLEAYGGILDGLNDPELMRRKKEVEDYMRKEYLLRPGAVDYWEQMDGYYTSMKNDASEVQVLRPSSFSGDILMLLFHIDGFLDALKKEKPEGELEEMKQDLVTAARSVSDPVQKEYLRVIFNELKTFAGPGDDYLDRILDGRTPEEAAEEILSKTVFTDTIKLVKFLDRRLKRIDNGKEPLVELSQELVPEYVKAYSTMAASQKERILLQNKLSQMMFEIFGYSVPPDATFTLRLQDGIVKGYDYNGTTAPYKTTYYGLYDRFYSFDQKDPFALPERWKNPPPEMLPVPLNFVSTNDVIGGNSGSPVINRNRELVGLVFDGNVESLPGNFIYNEKNNRTVSVHVAGLAAALKYIYKADRLLKELGL